MNSFTHDHCDATITRGNKSHLKLEGYKARLVSECEEADLNSKISEINTYYSKENTQYKNLFFQTIENLYAILDIMLSYANLHNRFIGPFFCYQKS